ncbi:MAG: toxin-antitoxin system TumE family protein [Methanotrichaceae archaeon]
MKVQDILDALSSSDIVEEIAVKVLVLEPGRQALRAVASLKGGYVHHINEALGRDFRHYSYHVQKEEKMVRRWDNAPHWPDMKTFPHHLHLGSEKKVSECREVFVEDVLNEMETIIRLEGADPS